MKNMNMNIPTDMEVLVVFGGEESECFHLMECCLDYSSYR